MSTDKNRMHDLIRKHALAFLESGTVRKYTSQGELVEAPITPADLEKLNKIALGAGMESASRDGAHATDGVAEDVLAKIMGEEGDGGPYQGKAIG